MTTWADLLPKELEEEFFLPRKFTCVPGYNRCLAECLVVLQQAQVEGRIAILPDEKEIMRVISEFMPHRYKDAVEPLARAILERLKK